MEESYRLLKRQFHSRIKESVPLGRYTTFKVGGPADLFFEATTKQELIDIVAAAKKYHVPMFLLGGGSNVLIGDKGVRGLVVKNNARAMRIVGAKGEVKAGKKEGTVYVEAESGAMINSLVRFTIEEGLEGLEMHLGLPGTVGGAVYMNSKWTLPEGYVGDVVYQATLIENSGNVKIVPRSYFRFAYDYSVLQKTHEVVVSVVFALKRASKEKLWQVANESIAYRRETQPHGVFSAGCTFRNISKAEAMAIPTPNQTTSAGFLVDQSQLKGLSVGEAQISPVHANFIINRGKATAEDVIKLITVAKQKVKRRFGVTLEEEIVHVGEF